MPTHLCDCMWALHCTVGLLLHVLHCDSVHVLLSVCTTLCIVLYSCALKDIHTHTHTHTDAHTDTYTCTHPPYTHTLTVWL